MLPSSIYSTLRFWGISRPWVFTQWMQPKYNPSRRENKQHSLRYQYEGKGLRFRAFKANWWESYSHIKCCSRNSWISWSWVCHTKFFFSFIFLDFLIYPNDFFTLHFFQVLCNSTVDPKKWCLQLWCCSSRVDLWKEACFNRRLWCWLEHCSLGMPPF